MPNILEVLKESTIQRVEKEKKIISLEEMIDMAHKQEKKPSFLNALQKDGMAYICEVKKASPSKGLIAPDFPYVDIAKEYEEAKASAISCLTEPEYFMGSIDYIKEITDVVSIPVLRKDFTVDPYMIYQAKAYGASAVLLICSILTKDQLKEYLDLTYSLGLDALVEAHDEEEVKLALEVGAKIIGVNNRDLKTFTIDMNNSIKLRKLAGKDVVFVSESGIKTSNDIQRLLDNDIHTVLIGETLMRSKNKKEMLESLNGKEL